MLTLKARLYLPFYPYSERGQMYINHRSSKLTRRFCFSFL